MLSILIDSFENYVWYDMNVVKKFLKNIILRRNKGKWVKMFLDFEDI